MSQSFTCATCGNGFTAPTGSKPTGPCPSCELPMTKGVLDSIVLHARQINGFIRTVERTDTGHYAVTFGSLATRNETYTLNADGTPDFDFPQPAPEA